MEYIYCDESCHLENDQSDVMVLGGLKVQRHMKPRIFNEIRDIKQKHGLSTWFEIKWTKITPSKIDFYLELIDYFFFNRNLGFRGIVLLNKNYLDHHRYGNTYDQWYYKMYYYLLNPMILPEHTYRVFIDIKDTNGGSKVRKLHEVLSNSKYDFRNEVVKDIKQIHSHESEIMQLCDLFIGALSYYHRGLHFTEGSPAKTDIINRIEDHIGQSLSTKTPPYENKFNLFLWEPQVVK
ncbi:DUF3800 domain-containing protein [Halobacillus sp. SY10]|uniref:DUF3800 domain-containing protein n=1 Tax=Halobacillus sp. SY10 TaxID=3381356 RepID=UPI003879688B